jgi:hypothetical protein
MSQNLDNHVLLRRSQIEEISINKMITNYKNIKPSPACVFVQNGNSCLDYVILQGKALSIEFICQIDCS